MKDIQLSSDVIIGLNWEEKQDVKAVLRVIPINVYGAPDDANIVITDGKLKSYPFQSGKIGPNSLLYVEDPLGAMPGADKAVIKVQFDGIPNTISKLLFVFTAVDSEGKLHPVSKLKRIPMWCATPTNRMDVIGSGGKLGTDDLAQYFDEASDVLVPLELARNSDDWILNTMPDGYEQNQEILDGLGITPPPPPPPLPTQSPDNTLPDGKMKAVEELIAGQKVEIPAGTDRVTVTLYAEGSFTPDISAFLLDGQTRPKVVGGDRGLIFYNQPQGANGAVTYNVNANSLTFELDRIPADIVRVAIVLSTVEKGKHFGQTKNLEAAFETSDRRYVYKPKAQSGSTAMDMCDVYRYKGKWKFNAKGVGANGGIEELGALYGVEIKIFSN